MDTQTSKRKVPDTIPQQTPSKRLASAPVPGAYRPASEATLYTPLPDHIKDSPCLRKESQPPLDHQKKFTPNFVKSKISPGNNVDVSYGTKVHGKVLSLDAPQKSSVEKDELVKKRDREKKSNRRTNGVKLMTAKERRETGVYDLPKNGLKFSSLLPLHELWKGYMKELLGNCNTSTCALKLLKADFHGCRMAVSKSKCPSYVGASGLMVKETENCFSIVTEKDKLKVIPKTNNVFTIEFEDKLFTIYGNQFKFRSADRAAKKWKSKTSIDL